MVEWCGGAERCDDDIGFEGFGGVEKLSGQVLVRLSQTLVSVLDLDSVTRTSSVLPLPVSLMMKGKASSAPVAASCRVRKAW